MIKLVVIDLDDTLFRDGNVISDEDRKAIGLLEERGYKVTLASGRSEATMVDFIRDLGLEHSRHVAVNGALLVDLVNGSEYVNCIPDDTYHELLDFLDREGRDHFCYCDRGLMYDEIKGKLWDIITYYHSRKAMIHGNVREIKNCPRVNTYYGSYEEQMYLKSMCPKGLYAIANRGVVDFLPEGMNKMSGILPLIDEYGITPDEIAVFGDQEGDREIFEGCGLAIAVANCDDIAREAADIVLDRTHNENAVAYGIYRYILRDEKLLEELTEND